LAQPDGFASQVQALGAKIVAKHIFPDHHWYSVQDLDLLERSFIQSSADFLITTEKDFVKLQRLPKQIKVLAIELETQWLTQFPQTVQDLVMKTVENS
jgi:tetraacyldisaccharide 4'-kinase